MAPLKKRGPNNPVQKQLDDEISKSRVMKALGLTFFCLLLLFLAARHLAWSIEVIYYRQYGLLQSIAIGVSTLLLHVFVSFKTASYLNQRFLEADLDVDNKKYI